jgi:hypothetical protein
MTTPSASDPCQLPPIADVRAVGADKSPIQYAAVDKLILYITDTSAETILREGVIV